jgi:curli production assembly/transport component CsgG
MNNSKYINYFLTAIFMVTVFGCATYMEPLKTINATVGTPSAVNKELRSLPAPKDKIVAAVYKFRDQTGQYKASQTSSTFSTAVTQGATSILLRALEESGWFIVIEREGLSDLLNERKIIRSSRANYQGDTGEDSQLLPPLLFAGVILEGGIISYDTNILTGGSGIKYFGVGASGQYRQDRVTIYLRAISTQSGRILKTVYTTKTILSQMVDVGLYRFVNFQRLLEVETGYSYNEPPEMCVTEAIEKAVQSLVIEGINENLWTLQNAADINSPVITRYEKEKETAVNTNYFGMENISPRKNFSVGINFGASQYNGDYPNPLTKLAGSIQVSYFPESDFGVSLTMGRRILEGQKFYQATINSIGLQAEYYMLPGYKLSPYLLAGLGLVVRDNDFFEFDKRWYPLFKTGAGAEYLVGKTGINMGLTFNYSLSDKLDNIDRGKYNDYYWEALFGVNYYIGR